MGVWIETFDSPEHLNEETVTPCMGVWIETVIQVNPITSTAGHTLYGCVD